MQKGSHGVAFYLKEKLLDTSDAYSTFVCDKCGLFATRMNRKDNMSHSSAKDIYYCPACKNYTEISKVMIPSIGGLYKTINYSDIYKLQKNFNNYNYFNQVIML